VAAGALRRQMRLMVILPAIVSRDGSSRALLQ
jgi:hypothetical protein